MQFVIGDNVNNKNPKNAYTVVGQFMHGDADGDSEEHFGLFDADTFQRRAYNGSLMPYTLQQCVAQINQLEAIIESSHGDVHKAEELMRSLPGVDYLVECFPMDATYQDVRATLTGFYIRYYDAQGAEHFVDILP